MRVCIVGTGYVGLVSGVGLASLGHHVTCVDLDQQRVDDINAGRCPIHEDGLDDLLQQVRENLTATTDLPAAVRDSEYTMICVGTPFDGESIDLSQIRSAAAAIGEALRDQTSRHTVVVKSTVVPGTTEEVVGPLLESGSGRRVGDDLGLGMNPEFLREGVAVADFMNPDRIVVGGVDDASIAAIAELYAPFEGVPVVRTLPRTAEMIKYTSNALLATLISFSNEVANLGATFGVDAGEVMRAVHLDRRLSPRLPDGEVVRPGILSYLEAGCGFGGSCFGKDVRALIELGGAQGESMAMLRSTIRINDDQPAKMIELLRRHHPNLDGLRVAVLGIAFKPGTDDTRESPALPVIASLVDAGADVIAYDPIADLDARPDLRDRVELATDLEDALRDAGALMLMTSWDEFQSVPDLIGGLDRPPVVIDGRRMIAKHSVPVYEAIGL